MKNILILCSVYLLIAGCSKSTVKPITSLTINGNTYAVVSIGNQLWTARNYDGPGGVANPSADEATLGKYYSLTEVNSLLLPSGWHVPTVDDYSKLLKSQGTVTTDGWGDILLDENGSSHLRSNSNWHVGGDNSSGFNAPGGGYYQPPSGQFYDRNAIAYYWTSSIPADSAYAGHRSIMVMQGYNVNIATVITPITTSSITIYKPPIGSFSLRFVKDN